HRRIGMIDQRRALARGGDLEPVNGCQRLRRLVQIPWQAHRPATDLLDEQRAHRQARPRVQRRDQARGMAGWPSTGEGGGLVVKILLCRYCKLTLPRHPEKDALNVADPQMVVRDSFDL